MNSTKTTRPLWSGLKKYRKLVNQKQKYMSPLEILKSIKTDVTIVPSLPDYSKHPTVIKKTEEAKEFLKKYGLPESFKNKK